MEENNGNKKQDICIAQIQKDVQRIFDELKEIKENHLHAINEEIKELKREVNSRPTWLMSAVISLCLMLLSFIIGYFIK